MTDKKISQLSSASTPLAGTEVLPIVQSATTVKVATDDLTVKNVRSNATSGILQVAGPAAAATRVMTIPDANFTAARTDAAQTFTGDQTLSTGNLVVSSGKGIDFTAAGGDVLSLYEIGSYEATMTAGTSGTITLNSSFNRLNYQKIGRLVFVQGYITASSVASPVGQLRLSVPYATSAIGGDTPQRSAWGASGGVLIIGGVSADALNYVIRWGDSLNYVIINIGNGASIADCADQIQGSNNTDMYLSFMYTSNA